MYERKAHVQCRVTKRHIKSLIALNHPTRLDNIVQTDHKFYVLIHQRLNNVKIENVQRHEKYIETFLVASLYSNAGILSNQLNPITTDDEHEYNHVPYL